MNAFKVIAPVRADLAGGTLDMWPLFCCLGEAKTINVALDLWASVHFEFTPSSTQRIQIRLAEGESAILDFPVSPDRIRKMSPSLQFPALIVSEYLRKYPSLRQSVTLTIEALAPVGSSLGGSSSLCIALAKGLARICGEEERPGWEFRMMEWAKDVEAKHMGKPTGTQDYLAALFGGLRCYSSRLGSIEKFSYPENVFHPLSERLLILFSGEMHHSGLTNWEVFKAALEGKKAVVKGIVGIQRLANHLDEELQSATLQWKEIGKLLNEEWRIRKTLFRVATKRLNDIMDFLRKQHVIGAKVCGAAGGGSLLVLTEPDQKLALARACKEKKIKVLPANATTKGVFIA